MRAGKGWELYKTRPLPRPKSPPPAPPSAALPQAQHKKRGRPPKAREPSPPRPRLAGVYIDESVLCNLQCGFLCHAFSGSRAPHATVKEKCRVLCIIAIPCSFEVFVPSVNRFHQAAIVHVQVAKAACPGCCQHRAAAVSPKSRAAPQKWPPKVPQRSAWSGCPCLRSVRQ